MSVVQSSAQFRILGVGHSESLVHFNNNALLETPQENMLIDCGHTIKHALDAQGLSFANIDSVYISHVHGDHVFGLERLAYESKFTYQKKVKLYLHPSIEIELWDQTLRGSLGQDSDGQYQLIDWFDVCYVEDEFCVGGLPLRLLKVKHTPNKPAFGLLINNSILYTTDTVAIPEVINHLTFEHCFHDVTLKDWNPVHASFSSLIEQYPKEVLAKIYVMSYEDNWQDHNDEVLKHVKGFAQQGQIIAL